MIDIQDLKDAAIWVFLALIGVLTWFAKSVLSEHNAMYENYTANKGVSLQNMILQIENLKGELEKVRTENRGYWSEHKNKMESNQEILLNRIEHSNDNQKAAAVMIMNFLEKLEKRMDKLEDK